MKIYTKTGDDGTTGLVGGSRVKKFDIRLEAYGTVDELNATLGVLRSMSIAEADKILIIEIQNKLFNIGSRLASDEKGEAYTANLAITDGNIELLEKAIDEYERNLPELTHFILPGGDPASAQCHVARTVCRRAERRVLEFAGEMPTHVNTMKYLNRLSDLLFVLSRKTARENGVAETAWKKD
ncbi:MAG: cob(I)yrinic acid a,c-diamide adenosyltransferase [Draconibacterium sp.]